MSGKTIGNLLILGGTALLAFLMFHIVTFIALGVIGTGVVTKKIAGSGEKSMLTAKAERALLR